MINICSQCGAYRAVEVVDSSRSVAVCPECSRTHPFRLTPLFVVGGASGAGKSAVAKPLIRKQPPVVVLETGILWRPEFDNPDQVEDYNVVDTSVTSVDETAQQVLAWLMERVAS